MAGEKSPLAVDTENVKHGRLHLPIKRLIAALVAAALFLGLSWSAPDARLGKAGDSLHKARDILTRYPLVDTHVDLPILLRGAFANQLSQFNLSDKMPGQVDIPRLRRGRVGGMFWSVYVPCASDAGYDEGPDFVNATHRVRDTLEQIDIALLSIERYDETFQLATSADGIEDAFSRGRIASLIGVEGSHQLGNSLSVLRAYYNLGARYVTLTHTCNNAFADSAGMQGRPIEERYGGLSAFGKTLVAEMNRLGMIIDISHTSVKTQHDVLTHSAAPVIYSHSNSASVFNVTRNVPESVLLRLAGRSQDHPPVKAPDVLIAITFAPQFIGPDPKNATAAQVADHIESIAQVVGRRALGIGSDFDGIESVPVDLRDVTAYEVLLAELIRRGWNESELAGLVGRNLLRVMRGVEAFAKAHHKTTSPATTLYDKRPDLPVKWPPRLK